MDGSGRPLEGGGAEARRQESPLEEELREAAAAQHAAMMRKRSQNLWRRVNPGCMEGYCGTPASTHSNNFQHVPDQIDPKTWDHHLQKTDFSHYVEEDAKQRQQEKQAKARA